MELRTPKNDKSEPADARLIEQIKNRQTEWKALFAKLVSRHQPALYARCMVYLRHPEDAADASQETLLRAYRAIDSFKGDAAFRTWLFAIADNQCHTLARRRSRHRIDEHTENMVRLHEEIRVAPADSTANGNDWIHNVLREITPTGRDVLQLRYFSELSIEEIAATLGLGISATKMRLYRAQDQIASLVGESTSSRII